jgi:peptidoglycan/xylan/chitin deacetylase (PgdA/CDA1 family)
MTRRKKIFLILAVVILVPPILGYGLLALMNSRTFQFFGGLTSRVHTQQKIVALTFDDGPTRDNTEAILNVLSEEHVPATFMLIGEEIHKNPLQAKQIVAAGHQIGNHSYSHQRMIFKSTAFYRDEIQKTDAEIRAAGFKGEIVFRPPFGKKLIGLPEYLASENRKTVMWDIEPESYPSVAVSTDAITHYTVEHTQPGSMILLHAMYAGGEKSRNALKPLIEQLKSKGYEFVTVSELIKHNN